MVSEYPFKHNKNMLKNMTVLLYTNFYDISLNVLRPTFFNTFNLPFLCSPNIGKIKVKFGPKLTTFSICLSSCTNRKNAGTVLCSSLLEMCVQSLKLILEAVFVLELVKCSPPRNVSLAKFL